MLKNQNGFIGVIVFIVLAIVLLGMGTYWITHPEHKNYDNKAELGTALCEGDELQCGYCPGEARGGYCYWND